MNWPKGSASGGSLGRVPRLVLGTIIVGAVLGLALAQPGTPSLKLASLLMTLLVLSLLITLMLGQVFAVLLKRAWAAWRLARRVRPGWRQH
jgi:uncharacterized membrane protein YcfT